jgi:lipopolysaccharide transport system permease protein
MTPIDIRQMSRIIFQMSSRAIQERYRGSILGVLWTILTPIFMLAVYTFIFTKVFTVRWGQDVSDVGTLQFSALLFVGLSLYSFLNEVVLQGGSIIIANSNYVKKVVFPLTTLPVILTISALFQLTVSLFVLIAFQGFISQKLELTIFIAPLILLPFIFLVLGVSWIVASLGTFIRDLNQILTPIITALLFLGPILYPIESLPEQIHFFLYLSPLTVPVEQLREVIIWGNHPNWSHLCLYTLASVGTFFLGNIWFRKTQKGFADVL